MSVKVFFTKNYTNMLGKTTLLLDQCGSYKLDPRVITENMQGPRLKRRTALPLHR
jgi:hypothetical protein